MMGFNSKDWIADLEHEDRNTAKSYQRCSIQEDIKRISSPGWDGQPAVLVNER